MPRRPLSLATLSAFLAAVPAFAQPVATDPMQRCQAYLRRLPPDVRPIDPPPQITASDDLCVYDGLRLGNSQTVISIRKASLNRLEPDPEDPEGFPLALDLSIEGLAVGIQSMGKTMLYINEQTSTDQSLTIRYEMDASKQALTVDALEWTTGDSTVKIQGAFNHLPAKLSGGIPMPRDDFAVKRVNVVIDDEDLQAQRTLAWSLGSSLLEGADDPAARTVELKDQAGVWMLSVLPKFNIDHSSIAALDFAMRSFPRAQGRLTINAEFPAPVGFRELTGIYTDNLNAEDVIPDGSVKVTYE